MLTANELHEIADMLEHQANAKLNEATAYRNGYVQACEDFGRAIREKLIGEKTRIKDMAASETLLLDYIMKYTYSCPLKDDAEIDFEKECVGYLEEGCKECILRHVEELR